MREKIYRKDNKIYVVNPIATIFSNDKYYLLCYDDKHGNLSHYRIDRMDNVNISVKEITPSDHFDSSLIQRHKRQLFGMYNGDEQEVMFECDKSIVDAVYDKFGFDIQLYDVSHNKFRFSAKVQLSPVFFGWCCSFGDKLKIASPEKVRTEFLSYIKTVGNNN